jgi:4-amino-4-deoxy-L-arabinose transferase-like glycosyltransferase
MKAAQQSFGDNLQERWLLAIAISLILPALFINLGLVPMFIHVDEPRRGLVALEMLLSGKWLVPTLNGELYFNKPPVYHWFIMLTYELTGSYDEFAVRLPMVLSIIGFGLSVYYFVRPQLGQRLAIMAAFMTITSGRLLFYDAFLGLLDITYSWFIYVELLLIYIFYQRRQWYALFALSYFLAAVTFLMKGLPTLLFQGFTLVAWLVLEKHWRKLFSLAHFVGLAIFIALVVAYYLAYLQQAPGSLDDILTRLWDESARRTVTRFGLWATILQTLTFPFDFISQFFPWTFLLLLLTRRDYLRKLWQQPFLRFNIVALLVNIPVYWTAPEVRPRYLFIFTALLFTALAYVYAEAKAHPDWRKRVVDVLLIMLSGLALLMPIVALVAPQTSSAPFAWLKAGVLLIALALLFWRNLRQRRHLVLQVAMVLLCVKVGYNWFILHSWLPDKNAELAKAERIIALADARPVAFLNSTVNFDGLSFYITAAQERIVPRHVGSPRPGFVYIGDARDYPGYKKELLWQFDARFRPGQEVALFRPQKNPAGTE